MEYLTSGCHWGLILCILSDILCVVYGAMYWNAPGDEKE